MAMVGDRLVAAQDLRPERAVQPEYKVAGAAFRQGQLFTWGSKLTAWSLPDLKARHVATGSFGEGGCLVDLDADGVLEWAGQSGGRSGPGGGELGELVWMNPRSWKPEHVDGEIEMHDCTEATLFGRRGLLMVNRHMQVRFYERSQARRWRYREIYSFYTASQQSGLLLADVDGDQRLDILCGNYWIHSPERFELPWRLFAINTDYQTPLAAMTRFWLADRNTLWTAQSHMEPAKVAKCLKPTDPTQLWPAMEPATRLNMRRAHALTGGDWYGRGGADVIVGENAGPASRLIAIAGGTAAPEVLARGVDTLEAYFVSAGQLLTVGTDNVSLWRYRSRK